MTISAGLMSGYSRSFAVKYSYIMSIPAIIGAMILELGQFGSDEMTAGLGVTYVLGMVIAAFVGALTIRGLLKIVHRGKFRVIAVYCFVIGFVSLVISYM